MSKHLAAKHLEKAGFAPPAGRSLGQERRTATLAELVACIGIAVCTVIAATVVSVGIARADSITSVIDSEGSLFAIALVLGLAFVALGGLSLLFSPDQKPQRQKM